MEYGFSDATLHTSPTITAALTEGRILTCYSGGIDFVVAHTDLDDDALDHATEINEGEGDAFTILLDDDDLARLTANPERPIVVTIYAAADDNRSIGVINVSAAPRVQINTSHGSVEAEPVLAEQINTGDVIINGESQEGTTLFAVQHATNGYDQHGSITHRPYGTSNRPEVYEYGAAQILYRVLACP